MNHIIIVVYIIALCVFNSLCAYAQKELTISYFGGLGTTVNLIPSTEETKAPVCFAMDFGVFFNEKHRLAYDWMGGGSKKKIGEWHWRQKEPNSMWYTPMTTDTHRKYKIRSPVFSYQYVLPLNIGSNLFDSDHFNSIRFGPSFGIYRIRAFSAYSANVTDQPEIDENVKLTKRNVFGFGIGATFYLDVLYLDI